jgi:hypothetical protein
LKTQWTELQAVRSIMAVVKTCDKVLAINNAAVKHSLNQSV